MPGGEVVPCNIGVKNGKISTLSTEKLEVGVGREINCENKTIIPGLVDQHFHSWWGYGVETHEIATRAAAKGGVTTIVEMPLDKPATLTSTLLHEKLKKIGNQYHVDYAAIGGYIGEDPEEMHRMVEAGVVAIKIFTGDVAPPGMFQGTYDGELLDLMKRVKQDDVALMVHCENSGIVEIETSHVKAAGKQGPVAWHEARPPVAELEAVQRIATIAKATGARVIIVHISTPEAVDVITAARRDGVDIWAETLPHQLCLSLETNQNDARLKWNPPVRPKDAVDGLWKRFAAGEIHSIASDHAPLTKIRGADIWSQNPGAGNVLETMLPVVATEAIHLRGIGLARIVEAMCATPARLLGIYPRKGAIMVGSDADLVVLEMNGHRVIDENSLEFYDQNSKWSPYHNKEVKVYPVQTILRGQVIYDNGEITGRLGFGEYVTKSSNKQ